MKVLRFLLSAAILCLLGPGLLSAQEVDRDSYLRQIPLSGPRLGPANLATMALDLYGDPAAPGYRDVAPVDGIDDARHRVLETLAVRFAPFLVQNTGNIPVRFQTYIENRTDFALNVDSWDVSAEEPERLASYSLNMSALNGQGCTADLRGRAFELHPQSTNDPQIEDCKLLDLMDRFSPGSGQTHSVDESRIRSNPSLFNVLFFDFPGDGSRTWQVAYQDEYRATPDEKKASFPHSYVHPFLIEVEGGFELLLQYWFFYPTNDSGMDHEGDWEHINVSVSPLSMVEGELDAVTVQNILEGRIPASDQATDPLVIKRVDFYFHDLVMPLDFSAPNVYLDREAWKQQADQIEQPRFREGEIWDQLGEMAWADEAETIINTHPFGFIGSDNKGPNQILEMPGGSNRNSHGTFPLPGRYNNVGPGGTTDQISGNIDRREFLTRLREGRETMGPDFRRGGVIGLADPDRLTLIPDWERVLELSRTDPAVRAEWAWLLLPLRWGYPATVSPFSGVLEHFNTGNVAPVGPSYSTGWNLSGPSSSFKLYEPHTLASIFPL